MQASQPSDFQINIRMFALRSAVINLVAMAVLTLSAIPACGQGLFWDGGTMNIGIDGDGLSAGTTGTWNTTLTNWDAGVSPHVAWVNANNSTAVFGGTAGTVSLGTGITVGGLQFDTTGYLVQTNTLTFGVSGNILTNADATINSALAATSGLTITKTGVGTLTLGGANTYAGNTTISAGTLKAGSTTALSANSAFSVAASAFLDLSGFNNTIKSLSTATGTITNSTGAATLKITTMAATAQLFTGSLALQWNANQINSSILTNTANTFSGGIIAGGSTGFNNRFLLGNTTIGTGTPGALTSGIWGTGAVTLGTATNEWSQILFTGAATINNAIVVNSALGNSDAAGAFRVDSSGSVIAGAINANLAAANFRNGGNGTGAINVTGAIFGNSGLTLLAGNGTGTLNVTLSNVGTVSSYAGDTIVSSAKETLTLGAANQIPNGAGKGNLIVTGGNFNMGGFSETINGLSGTGTVDGVSGTPTLTVGDNDATGSSNTFSGVIKNTAGTLALTKTGTGTLTLSGNNTYSGATTVSGGTLKAGSTTGLSANSAFSVSAGGTLDLGGFNNTIKSLTPDTATSIITDSSGAGLGGTLRIANAMGGTLSAQLFTGSLGLQFFGGPTNNTILSNTANTYSGGTILGNGSGATTTRILLGGGTLGAGSPGAVTSGIFGTGAITIGAATTDRSQLYFSGALTINNAIVVNSSQGDGAQFGAFRHEAPGSGVVIAGTVNANLADVMALSANGTSTRTLSFTNTISGNSGLQVLTQASAILNVTLNNAGTANSYAGNTTIGTANSSLTLGAANQIPNGAGKGNLIVTAGTFKMGGFSETINGLSGTGTVDGTSGTPTLTVGDNDATGVANTFSGVIKNTAGTLALNKIGSGTLTLTGNGNAYTGLTTVSAGTLIVNGDQTTATGAVSVAPGATLGGDGTIGGDTTIGGNLRVGSDTAAGTTGSLTFASGRDLSFASGSAWFIDIVNDNFDSLGGIDVITIDSSAILNFAFTGTQTQSSYTLATYSSRANANTFSGLADGAFVGGGYQINYGTTAITLTAIPEPSTAISLGLLLAGAMRYGRRRMGRTS